VKPARSAALFALVVLLCLTQVGWWIYFQFRETARLEDAAALLVRGEPAAAARALGADDTGSLAEHVRRRRVMFASEGAALGVFVLVGVVFFYAAWMRERRMREQQRRFLTGATHELKTPLATVRLGLESLLEDRVPLQRREHYLRSMIGEVDRLERGATNLLTAAALHERTQALRRSVGDLALDVEDALAELAPRLEAAELRLERQLASGVAVARDPDALRIVLRNLLDNAIKYSARGGAVRVALERAGGDAVLRVADGGAGMDADELHHAFAPFYRGAAKNHVGGSGLGLHLVAELVRAHGGSVGAASPGPGRGSEFSVRLPLAGDGGGGR
jgi:signal transduction histidine kinase